VDVAATLDASWLELRAGKTRLRVAGDSRAGNSEVIAWGRSRTETDSQNKHVST
jgi:hypothetical protein